ncbi:MAG: purine-nucleoside phosphorylase [Firmicutes bacterium]|nr:purine-nucleoside phosphorylase [Bacillota bacterium]
MPTAHNEAKIGEISNIVLMSGDPLRAKYIAEKYLNDYKLVNDVRGMYAYTGYYKDKRITVMGHGMGMPSIGIYAYELYKFYNVDTIIRMGSCGTHDKNIKLGDTVLATSVNTPSNFSMEMFDKDIKELNAFDDINFIIKSVAKKNNIELKEEVVTTSSVFDVYFEHIKNNEEYKILEMEAFALFLIAHELKKECACLLTVVDEAYSTNQISSEDREKNLNNMILIALESALEL